MRPPVAHIVVPPFPAALSWFNSQPRQMAQELGHPVLIEFWDFCRPNSIRTLPYVKAWYERYRGDGLQVIGVHASGFPPSADPEAVGEAVARLGIEYPVVVDVDFEIWQLYGNLGWPARYLWNHEGNLAEYHYGEGEYEQTERAIQELLGIERPTIPPLRPEDAPGAALAAQSEDVPGPYSGPYEAGAVWAVLEGEGSVSANEVTIPVDHPGCYQLLEHPRSTGGELELELVGAVTCHGVCFTPGLT